MIEAVHTPATEAAFAKAHAARAAVLKEFFLWLFPHHSAPLAPRGLTEPCR